MLLLAAIGVAAIVTALGVEARVVARSLVVGVIVGLVVGIVLGLNLTNRGWGLAGDSILPLADPGARALAAALVVLPLALGVLAGLLSLIRNLRAGAGGTAPPAAARVSVALPTALYIGWLAGFLYSYSSRVAWPELAIVGIGAAGFVVSLAIIVVIGAWRPGSAFITGLGAGTALGVVLAGLTALGLGKRVGGAIGVTVGLGTWIGVTAREMVRHGVDGEEFMKQFVPQKTMDVTKETIEWARARMPLSRRS